MFLKAENVIIYYKAIPNIPSSSVPSEEIQVFDIMVRFVNAAVIFRKDKTKIIYLLRRIINNGLHNFICKCTLAIIK